MREILLVDGYNMLNAWPDLIKLRDESFDHAREKLLDILANFQALEGSAVVVVFDGYQVKGGSGGREWHAGVEVIFTPEGETADACIERLVAYLPEGTRVTVATSDWAQQRLVMGYGALRLSARELLIRIREVETEGRSSLQRFPEKEPAIDDRIDSAVKNELEKWRRGKG